MSSDNSKEAIQEHIRVYMMVFGALAVLTVITVLASFLKVSTSEAIFLALIISLYYFLTLIYTCKFIAICQKSRLKRIKIIIIRCNLR